VRWEVLVRREVEPLIDALKGKRAGYGAAVRQLELDPCVEFPTDDGGTRSFAYRLSGPLAPKVCGLHLFDDENTPDGHLRPPCCGDGLPAIDDTELAEFMSRLRRLLR
jgi:hypothetical protein